MPPNLLGLLQPQGQLDDETRREIFGLLSGEERRELNNSLAAPRANTGLEALEKALFLGSMIPTPAGDVADIGYFSSRMREPEYRESFLDRPKSLLRPSDEPYISGAERKRMLDAGDPNALSGLAGFGGEQRQAFHLQWPFNEAQTDAAALLPIVPGSIKALRRADAADGLLAPQRAEGGLLGADPPLAPELQARLDKVIDKVPGFRAIADNLTPGEITHLNSRRAARMVEVFGQLPAAEEMASVAAAGAIKRGWYQDSAQAIHEVFGDDSPRFAQLLAAMSPQTSVENNLQNAVTTWVNWVKAGRPTDQESIVRIMGESVQGARGADSVLPAWINNSVRALTSEEPLSNVLSGPKVDSFWRNLVGEVDEVTNDAWMANYAGVDQTLFSGGINASGTDAGRGGGYLAMSALAREAADVLTARTGSNWTASEVQETVWSWSKGLYELRAAAGETRTAGQILEAGDLLDEILNEVPEFGTMLRDPRYAGPLREAGYGDELDELIGAATASERGPQARASSELAAEPGHLSSAAARLDALYNARAEAKAKR